MKSLRTLTLGVVVAGVAATAQAQADVPGRNTTLLSTASLMKLRDATQRLVTLAQDQPALAHRIPAIPGPDDKLDPAIEQVRQTPPVLDVLRKTDLSPRAWLEDLASFSQAIAARELARPGGRPIVPGVVEQNIRTLRREPSLTRDILRYLERLSLLQQRQGG